MIYRKFLCGPINGRYHSIQIDQSKPKRFFFKKTHKLSHLSVLFNNILVKSASTQKDLSVYLDEKLNFNTHNSEKIVRELKLSKNGKKVFQETPH